MHPSPRVGGLAGLALCFALAGCKESSAPAPIDPVGSWSGTTSQGRALSFTITAQGLASASLDWHLAGTACSYDARATLSSSSPTPVAPPSFTATYPLSGSFGADFTISGTFTSSTAAHGTLVIADVSCSGTLNATWTATKS
jgi:hypothetical protein